jgi:hypothetical protein
MVVSGGKSSGHLTRSRGVQSRAVRSSRSHTCKRVDVRTPRAPVTNCRWVPPRSPRLTRGVGSPRNHREIDRRAVTGRGTEVLPDDWPAERRSSVRRTDEALAAVPMNGRPRFRFRSLSKGRLGQRQFFPLSRTRRSSACESADRFVHDARGGAERGGAHVRVTRSGVSRVRAPGRSAESGDRIASGRVSPGRAGRSKSRKAASRSERLGVGEKTARDAAGKRRGRGEADGDDEQ